MSAADVPDGSDVTSEATAALAALVREVRGYETRIELLRQENEDLRREVATFRAREGDYSGYDHS